MALTHRLHGAPNPDTPGVTLGDGRGYDRCSRFCFAGRRSRAFGKLVAVTGAQDGDRVLDVGCGTGYLARRFGRAVAPRGSVVGVDASKAMLDYAASLEPMSNVSFTVGVAEALEFEDESFDVVTSSLMLHHLPEELRGRAVSEMARVLRPGGRLLIADFRPPQSAMMRQIVGHVFGEAMQHNPIDAVQPMVEAAGLRQLRSGDAPLMRYVTGTKQAV